MKIFWRKKSWQSGYKSGKSEHAKEVKSLNASNKKLKAELTRLEKSSKVKEEKLTNGYEKKIKTIIVENEKKLKSIYKRMDYRIDKAEKAIQDSNRLLKKLKAFETWVVTQFQKSIQAQTGFVNGLTSQIDGFMIEQERIQKELTKIAQEKKLFESRNPKNIIKKIN